MRTYGEAVDVRPVRPDLDLDLDLDTVVPGQFLWRGRLYVVLAVLAHWVELGPWWTGGTGRTRGTGSGPTGRRSVAQDVGAVEREVWRVEARAGRSSSVGVYDLVHDVPPSGPGAGEGSGRAPSRWRLARALD